MTITEIWRYPVKSMQGERLLEATIDGDGVLGDRRFAVQDLENGRVLTGRRLPALLMCAATFGDDSEVLIAVPGRGRVRSDATDVDRLLSEWLAHPVRLVRVGGAAGAQIDLPVPEEVVEVYGTAGPTDLVVGLGSGFKDVAHIHCLTRTDTGGEDARRFRPNLLLEDPGEPLREGERLRWGEVELAIAKPALRCVMVTRPQPGLAAHPGLLRELVQRSRALVGVYATVIRGGGIAVGSS